MEATSAVPASHQPAPEIEVIWRVLDAVTFKALRYGRSAWLGHSSGTGKAAHTTRYTLLERTDNDHFGY